MDKTRQSRSWITLKITVPDEMVDAVINFCHEHGSKGAILDDSRPGMTSITAYFPIETWDVVSQLVQEILGRIARDFFGPARACCGDIASAKRELGPHVESPLQECEDRQTPDGNSTLAQAEEREKRSNHHRASRSLWYWNSRDDPRLPHVARRGPRRAEQG